MYFKNRVIRVVPKRCDCTPNTVWLHSNTSCRACQQAIQWFFRFAQNRGNYFWTHCCWKVESIVENEKNRMVPACPLDAIRFYGLSKDNPTSVGIRFVRIFSNTNGGEVIRFLCEWVLFAKKKEFHEQFNLLFLIAA